MAQKKHTSPRVKNILILAFVALPIGYSVGTVSRPVSGKAGEGAQPSGEFRASERLQKAKKGASRALTILNSSRPSGAGELLTVFRGLHPMDQEVLLFHMDAGFQEDPETKLALVNQFFLRWFGEDPSAARQALQGFKFHPELAKLDRFLLQKWSGQDFEGMTEDFLHRSIRDNTASESSMGKLAAIYQNERRDSLGAWISWLEGLKDKPGADNLRDAGINALAMTVTDETRKEVLDLVSRNLDRRPLWTAAGTILAGHIRKDSGEAMQWLEKTLPPGPWRDAALNRVFSELGAIQPELAIELLNDQKFLGRVYAPYSVGENHGVTLVKLDEAENRKRYELFYDTMLDHFMSTALVHDPQMALESADAFHNQKLAEKYRQRARKLLQSIQERDNQQMTPDKP